MQNYGVPIGFRLIVNAPSAISFLIVQNGVIHLDGLPRSNRCPMNSSRVASIHVGKVAPLGIEGVQSGFVKHATTGPVSVTLSGILGDEQADLRVHGGPDKAVYGYGLSHYAK